MAFALVVHAGCGVDDRDVSVADSGGNAGALPALGDVEGGAPPPNGTGGGSMLGMPGGGEARVGGTGGSNLPTSNGMEGPLPVPAPSSSARGDAGPELAEPKPQSEPPPGSVFQNGPWQGFVSVTSDDLGTTVSPTSFDDHAPGAPYCILGTVAANEFFGSYVALEFTVAQAAAASDGMAPPRGTAMPRGLGVRFELSSQGGGVMRAQLTSNGRYWCRAVNVLSGQVFIPYDEFREQCWLEAEQSVQYASEPFESLMFVVPGGAEDPVPFDFCIQGLGEGAP